MRMKTSMLASVAGMACAAAASRADDRFWIAAFGGNFGTAANWSPSSVPGAADRALFDLDETYSVTFSGTRTNDRAVIRQDTLTWNLSFGATYNLTTTSGTSLIVGGSALLPGEPGDVGVLTLFAAAPGGTLNTQHAAIGGLGPLVLAGSGRIDVNAGATWNNSQILHIGAGATGTLNLQGGDVNSGSSILGERRPGTVNLTNAASLFSSSSTLDIGANTTGTVNVAAGHARCQDALVGIAAGAPGNIIVNGASSRFQCTRALTLGFNGTASVNVTAGGLLEAGLPNYPCYLAEQSGSSAQVTVAGANSRFRINNSPDFYIGRMGPATVSVQSGGILQSGGRTFLAWHPIATANMTLNAGTFNCFNDLFVGGGPGGAGGAATLSLQNGSALTMGPGDNLTIWGPGTVSLSGSTMTVGDLAVSGGTFNWSSGTLRFLNPFRVSPTGQLGAAPTIVSGRQLEAPYVEVNGPSAHLTIAGGSVEGDLFVGATGPGQVSMTSGTLTTRNLLLGQSPSSVGTVEVGGPSSQWTIGEFGLNIPNSIGLSGTGRVHLSNGARADIAYAPFALGENAGSSGELALATDAEFTASVYGLTIGRAGAGTLSVSSGADLTGEVVVADLPGSTGNVSVIGAGSTLDGATLLVGSSGQGSVSVGAGGQVTVGDVYIADREESSSLLTVNGAGALLRAEERPGGYGNLIVGGAGNGTLRAEAGAQVLALEAFVGDGSDAEGSLVVTGPGSLLDCDDLVAIGYNGAGNLELSAGGRIETLVCMVGQRLGSSGTGVITGPGTTMQVGVLNVGGGDSGDLSIADQAAVQVNGTTSVNPSGSLALDRAQLSTGNLVLSGELESVLGGPGPGQYGRAAAGVIALGGVLRITLVPGFVPRAGDSFTILTASSISGAFSSVDLPVLQGGNLRLVQEPSAVRVVMCYANCDASTTPPALNVADFTCFLQHFAAGSGYANCDSSTAPPSLNVADFTCFLQNFAQGCP